jgi:tetratricopeptide (TPR) repeat protein
MADARSTAVVTLRIRAYSRLNELDNAIRLFSQHDEQAERESLQDGNPDSVAFYAWGARALSKRGDVTNARGLITLALAAAESHGLHNNAVGEVRYIFAMILSQQGEVELSKDYLRTALAQLEEPDGQAAAFEWQAFQHGMDGDRIAQVRAFEKAWGCIASAPERDQFLAANALFNSSLHAVEMGNSSILSELRNRANLLTWSRVMQANRFHVLRFQAFAACLDGDLLAAFDLWRASAALAPTPAMKLLSYLDRARIALEMGERTLGLSHYQFALKLNETIRWEDTTGQDRVILLHLAALAAAEDPSLAERLVAEHVRIRAGYDVGSAFNFDALLLRGPEHLAAAAIADARGRINEAILHYREAFDTYQRLLFRPRAADAAIALHGLGAAEEEHSAHLLAVARDFPRSRYARRALALLGTRALREVDES